MSAQHAVDSEVRLYDKLFSTENPDDMPEGQDFAQGLNPDSLEILHACKLEPSLSTATSGTRYQFERLGYFCADSEDSRPDALVFNRTVTLKDTWARIQKRQSQG